MENGENKHKKAFFMEIVLSYLEILLNVWFGAYLENIMDRKVSVSVGF